MAKRSDTKMENSVNWREEIAWIAGPFDYRNSRESWLQRAAKRSGVTFRTMKALFYGQRENPGYEIGNKIREAAKGARAEALALANQFETIAGGLHAKDADFHSADIAALIGAARAIRGLDSSGDRGT